MNAPTNLQQLRQQSAGQVQQAKRSVKDIEALPRERQFPAMLDAFKAEIKVALPKHLSADRMARIALTCFRRTPKLAKCDPRSVFAAVIQASQLGLEPGLLGQAYLIPYGDECQLIPGYQGLIDLARRSGHVISIEAHVVYTKDKFTLSYGIKPALEHIPNIDDADRGERRCAYAVAHLKDGGIHVEVMARAEIESIRDRSQNVVNAKKYSKKTPWDTDTDEMWRKTVLRRICKFLPKSPELAYAIELDRAASQSINQRLADTLDDSIAGDYTVIDEETGEVIEGGDAKPEADSTAAPEAGQSDTDNQRSGAVQGGQQDKPTSAKKPRSVE